MTFDHKVVEGLFEKWADTKSLALNRLKTQKSRLDLNSKMLKNKANRCSRRELIQQLLKFEAQKNEQIRFFPQKGGFLKTGNNYRADRFSSQVGVFSLIETSVVIEVELREAADR